MRDGTALQALVTRRFDVFDPVVLTVGYVRAGTSPHVVPDSARFQASVRSFSRNPAPGLSLARPALSPPSPATPADPCRRLVMPQVCRVDTEQRIAGAVGAVRRSAFSSYLLSQRCSHRVPGTPTHVCAASQPVPGYSRARASEQLPDQPPHLPVVHLRVFPQVNHWSARPEGFEPPALLLRNYPRRSAVATCEDARRSRAS